LLNNSKQKSGQVDIVVYLRFRIIPHPLESKPKINTKQGSLGKRLNINVAIDSQNLTTQNKDKALKGA